MPRRDGEGPETFRAGAARSRGSGSALSRPSHLRRWQGPHACAGGRRLVLGLDGGPLGARHSARRPAAAGSASAPRARGAPPRGARRRGSRAAARRESSSPPISRSSCRSVAMRATCSRTASSAFMSASTDRPSIASLRRRRALALASVASMRPFSRVRLRISSRKRTRFALASSASLAHALELALGALQIVHQRLLVLDQRERQLVVSAPDRARGCRRAAARSRRAAR